MSAGHGEKQSRQEEAAIAALLSCRTILEAAKAVGIGEATLRRWMKEPGFAAHYREARRQVVQHSIGALQGATSKAVATLLRIMDCDSPSAAASAARTVIERAHEAIELEDVLQRVDEIERALAGKKDGTL